MAKRIIPCQISNEYVKGAGVPVGAAGSFNDVLLELAFGEMWAGLTKEITWLDANGENPTITILTTNLLAPGSTSVYLVPIPAEPKRISGEMTMTVRGVEVDGNRASRATLTTSCHFIVLPSDFDENALESGDVNATQTEQLQGQIDSIRADIVEAAAAADAKEAAQAARAGAEAAVGNATASSEAAAQSAALALASRNEAANFAANAEAQKNAAQAAAEQAAEQVTEQLEEYVSEAEAARDQAQGYAESASVPAAVGVYNVVLSDRVTGAKYALIVESGRLVLLEVTNSVNATELIVIDANTGISYAVVVDNGRLGTEEV